jgi:hypothetical protein
MKQHLLDFSPKTMRGRSHEMLLFSEKDSSTTMAARGDGWGERDAFYLSLVYLFVIIFGC